MLLEETALPPNAVRTIRLSTASFLDAVLTQDGTPIYSFLTRNSTTKLCRYNLKKASDSCPPLVEVATVYWSEHETPSPPSPAGVSFLKPLWTRAIKRGPKRDCTTLVDVDGRNMQLDDLLRLSAMGG
ncbi:hypothetical protein M407DRAFT_25319 [Tulasnella calospora MUT 4182]|uniref:Uncharacterized protein n=1 Tax=Tulasnella calospora MUT 4182 TaxID=1051891 RepID=A0A0C3QHP4_9AGAM|nr:hypothetical protein M407DRAFT_25319 [Tulasnella calospora MUT 4182]